MLNGVPQISNIHYFPRYSTKENTVTNNTLLLISRIYAHSPIRASKLLTNLTDESIEIGIEVSQQQRRGNSVPDGAIIQRPFKVLIEAKVDTGVRIDQLLEHARGFTDEGPNILLLLSREPITIGEDRTVRTALAEHPHVLFKNVTFEALCQEAAALYSDYEYEMVELIQDFVDYCDELELRNQMRDRLRIVPCGTSFTVNLRYGIYFQPSDRGYTSHKYVGIYKDKTVSAIWELDSVFDVTYVDGNLTRELVQGRETDNYDDKLISIIRDARVECGYEIELGHRFFCGDLKHTEFRKSSSGGIMGARFINLADTVGEFTDTQDLANKLRGQQFE